MLIKSRDELRKQIGICMTKKAVAVDTETTAFPSPHNVGLKNLALVLSEARMTAFSFAHDEGSFVVLTEFYDSQEGLPLSVIVSEISPFISSPNVTKVMHNANYDVYVFLNHGIVCRNIFCTLLAASMQDANLPKSLKERACHVGMFLHQLKTVKTVEEFVEYARQDAEATYRLYEAYMNGRSFGEYDASALKLDKWQRYFLFNQEFPILQICLKAERRGMAIDLKYLKELESRLKRVSADAKKEILSYSKKPFNINSNRELADFLFGELGLPVSGFTPTGQAAVDKKTIDYLDGKHPVIGLLKKVRLCDKLLSNYASFETGIPAYADSCGVVHATMNSNQAVTGRFSVQNPALQTLPRESTIEAILGQGFSIRRAFIPRDGHVFIDRDFSQIELRMTAIFSRDSRMVSVYNHDCAVSGCDLSNGKCETGDIHSTTAKMCKVSRQSAKAVNFGLVYGMGPRKLCEYLGLSGAPVSLEEAQRIYRAYHEAYSGIRLFHDRVIEEHLVNGFILLITGRRRVVPNLKSPDKSKAAAARREVVNNAIQGSCADLIKQAMINLDRDVELKKAGVHLLLQVHDELLFECPERLAEEMSDRIKAVMETPPVNTVYEICVPILSEGGIGKNFAECK